MKIAGWALGLSLAVAGIGAAIGTSHIVTGNAPTMVKATDTDVDGLYTVKLDEKGYENGDVVTSVALTNAKFSMVFALGDNSNGNSPKYYTSGASVRTYVGNTLTITPVDGWQITGISFTYDSNKSQTANRGTLSDDKSTWSGVVTHDAPLIFTTGSSQTRYKSLAISYSEVSTEPVLSIDNFASPYGIQNSILPGGTGTFTFAWDVSTPDIDKGTVAWSTSGVNASKLSIVPSAGAYTASSDVTEKTEITLNLEITDNNSKVYNASKTIYICPHALTGANLSRNSLRSAFTIDETVAIAQTGAKLYATFMDVGSIDVLNAENNYGGTISYALGGTPISNDYRFLIEDNGKSLVVSYTFAGETVHASGYTITVAEKPVDHPSLASGWNLVTDAATLQVGDTVIIAAKNAEVAMSTTQNTNNRAQTAIDKSSDGTKLDADPGASVQAFTLTEGTKSGTFGFDAGDGFIYAASSSSNYLRTEATLSDNSSFTISVSSGSATITAQGTNTRNKIRYNSNSSVFACYSSGQDDVALYKQTVVGNNEYLQDWVYNYMHFQTIAEADVSDGTNCKGPTGYYLTAKSALSTLEGSHSGCIALLEAGGSFAKAKDRYEKWALANGDGAPYDGQSGIVTPLGSLRIVGGLDDAGASMPLVVTIAALGTAAAAGFFLFQRKRKEN